MSVELDPPELGFKRPFTQEVSQVLRLANPGSDAIAFKVKTTAPKQYCVRPNSGKIEPNSHVEVQVLLQAMKEDPPPDARCRDKFLVQSVAVDAGTDAANIGSVWNNIETVAKSSVQEKKIRVNFLPADGDATTNGVASSMHTDDGAPPPAYSSPSPSAVTPARSAVSGMGEKSPSPETSTPAQTSNTGNTMLGSSFDSTSNTNSGSSSALPTNSAELQSKLDNANATIARLRAEAADGLRQRKPQETAEKAVEQVKQSMQNAPAPGGVPLPVVALLCLLCFIVAWFFF